ncbi:unnamed protein product [Blumeria hordei]|uniref:Uncharacterized protein n=1 Tax=Blumeria hordei TaxID=2867405 RepID=A0A383UU49_BLUHO|nr:unnamed protein product [Blumeria hordei]
MDSLFPNEPAVCRFDKHSESKKARRAVSHFKNHYKSSKCAITENPGFFPKLSEDPSTWTRILLSP